MIRTVVVGAAADGDRKAVGAVISENKQVSASLGGAVRAARVDRSLLCEEEVRAVEWQIAVYFISGYLMITLDSVLSAGIHQNSSTDDVRVQENLRVLDGAVYMALCCEVYNHIRMLLLEELVDCFAVSDAFFYKTEIRIVHDRCQGREIAGIGQAVQTDDPVIRVFFQHVKNKVASDKSGTAGYDNIHSVSPLWYVKLVMVT